MTYFTNNSITTKCQICGVMIPSCQTICVRCEWKKKEEEDVKDMKEQEKKDERFWEIVHER
jgi:hypothetical protein